MRLRHYTLYILHSALAACALCAQTAQAAQAAQTFDDAIKATRARLLGACGLEKLTTMSPQELAASLTADERRLLGSTFVSFHISEPAWVHVLTLPVKNNDPFWLVERGFVRGEGHWGTELRTYETWSRKFPAGHVGLGLPAITDVRRNYTVVITPSEKGGSEPEITQLNPTTLQLGKVTLGESLYTDRENLLVKAPSEFIGRTLIRTQNADCDKGQLHDIFRLSPRPSSSRPDNILLTWTDDPATTQTIRWRTNTTVAHGLLALSEGTVSAFDVASAKKIPALTEEHGVFDIANDPVIHLHTVRLANLNPGTTYTYSIQSRSQSESQSESQSGSQSRSGPSGRLDNSSAWTNPVSFTTAPATPESFSFIYLGDVQYGFQEWGRMMRDALKKRPDAAFVLIAGDLVNKGGDRCEWDDFFHNAAGLFDRRPIVPVIGNHDNLGQNAFLYRSYFAVPANGPKTIGPGRAYSFEYSNAIFIVLDSNTDIPGQAAWLDGQLRNTKTLWKIVTCHYPAYPSSDRDGYPYPEIRKHWVPVFDRHRVDLVLQGHDHAYLRTHPMRSGRPVEKPADGTIYLITVSGTHAYEQARHDYTKVGFAKPPTWQIIDIKAGDPELHYRAYDADGNTRDEFIIKPGLNYGHLEKSTH